MPAVEMQKVAIAAHLSEKENVLSVLQKARAIQITSSAEQQAGRDAYAEEESALPDLERAIGLLSRISGKKKNFIENFAPYKEPVRLSELKRTALHHDWRSVLKESKGLEAELAGLENLLNALQKEKDALLPWRTLKIRLNQLACTKKTCVITGAIKTKKEQKLLEAIEKECPDAAAQKISEHGDSSYVVIFYLAASSGLDDVLAKYAFARTSLPLSERTASEELEAIARSQNEAASERTKILESLEKLVPELPVVMKVYDYLYQQSVKRAAERKAGSTGRTFYLTGWVPRSRLKELEKELDIKAPSSAMAIIEPEKGEVPPALLKNPGFLYPFELITSIFGFPGEGETDPTGPLSFFYILFFAMCLSDVGYGIILAAVSYYFLKKLTLSEGGKKLLLLMFMGGIATVFMGVVTGTYFSVELSSVPAPVGPLLTKLRLIDPIKSPLVVLIISVGLGLLQNVFGVFVSMISKIGKGDWIDGVLDDGLWIFFLLSLSGFAAVAVAAPGLSQMFSRLSIVGAVLLVLTQGRKEKLLIQKAFMGILSLYRTTSFLGDTLSYSRLLALMMTTSIIGMVINLIAGLTAGIPYVGYIVMAAILVGGHIFNLVISVLSAFIHSARLQLVEFFSKFYTGSGREFKPMGYETKYVIIK